LATGVGGVPELVIDNQTGQLIQSGSPTELANGIYDLLQNSERAACLAEQGQRRLMQSFSIEQKARAMTTLYRQGAGYVI
jgi:glycosyltransferase involved in cell wall biosynthesis